MKSIITARAKVLELAKKYGYQCTDFQENIGLITFKKESVKIHIYLTKMTVVTIVSHPTKGRNQLIRKAVYSSTAIEDVFKNPRVHTGKGYYGGGQLKTPPKSDNPKVKKNYYEFKIWRYYFKFRVVKV